MEPAPVRRASRARDMAACSAVACKKINRSVTHTHTHTERERERTTPPTPTHAHDKNNTPNPQTNTSHTHLTTLEAAWKMTNRGSLKIVQTVVIYKTMVGAGPPRESGLGHGGILGSGLEEDTNRYRE